MQYAYDLKDHLIGEYQQDGTPIREYIWLGDLLVAVIDTNPDGSTTAYAVETDHLGTPRLLTDATQQARWRWTSPPFGDVPPAEDPSGLGKVTFNVRFPGQYYDRESGLSYNWNRYYQAETGRYVQSDPIGLQGGWNTYGYVGGNPLRYTDPTGLVAGVDDAIVIGGTLAVSACIATNCTKPISDAMQGAANAISNILSESQEGSPASKKKGIEQWNKQPPIKPGLYTCRYVMYFPEDQCKGGQCPPYVTGRGYSPMLTSAMSQARMEAQEKIPPGCGHQHHGQMWCRYGGDSPFMP